MSSKRRSPRTDRKKPKRAPAVDRRVARTRAALHEAMIGLILTTDYEAISVADIVDRANVGRSTFYAHFTDKDDLVRDSAGRLREMMVEHGRAAAGSDHSGGPFEFSRFMFKHTREQLRLYRSLVKGRAGAIILDSLRRVLADFIRDDLRKLRNERNLTPTVPLEAEVQFLVGGFMAMLTWWLDRGAREPPEAMDAAFRALVMQGA